MMGSAEPEPILPANNKLCLGGFVRVEVETSPSEQTLMAVRAGMRRDTESQVPWEEYSDLR